MALKRIIIIYAWVWIVVGCLNLSGQPTSSLPAVAPIPPNRTAEELDKTPLRTIASFAREWQAGRTKTNALIHLRGSILDQRVGEYIVIRDDTGTMLAEGSQTVSVKMQTVVDVWGSPVGDLNRPYLRQSTFRVMDQPAEASATSQRPVTLPVLTKVRQIHELTPNQAGWEYPVKIRGVITLAYQHMRTYVEDDTAGIYIRSRQFSGDFKPGDLVEIEGTSNPGWYAPIIVPSKMTVVGTAPLPEAPQVSLFQMANGQYDSQWVADNAVVRSAHLENGVLSLKLSDRDGTFIANIPSDTLPTNLLDAVVNIRGVCVSQFNNKRQITGVEMWTPRLTDLQIREPSAANPFSLPLKSIVGLSQSRARTSLQRRAKVAGIVTASDPGKSFFLQDMDDAIQVFPNDKTAVKIGDHVEVVGYPALGDYGAVVRDAILRITGNGSLPPARPVPRDMPLDGQLNDLWVQTEAEVTGEPETEPTLVIPLQIGNTLFKARLLTPSTPQDFPPRGSVIRVSGIYQVLTDDLRAPRAFQLLVPDAANIQILNRPSLWTLRHTMLVVGILGVTAGFALLWVLILRRKVTEQTASLQQSEMKFRSLVEQSLVGVYVVQDGRFVYANPRMAEIHGYSVEEFTSPAVTLKHTVTEEDWPLVENQIQCRLKGEISASHYSLRARRKDGFLINLEVLGSLGQYNGSPAIFGTAMDVTDRKLAESKLAEASNLLETLLTNSPDYIYFKDRNSRFVRYSNGFEKFFQLADVKTLKGKSDFDFFMAEHARSVFEDEQEIMRTGEPLIGKLETAQHDDGRITYALSTKVPWRDPAGNIIGTFGVSKDVTALKDTEAKLTYERDLFYSLLDNFPDVIYFKDLKCRFVRVSLSKAAASLAIVRARYLVRHPGTQPEKMPVHLQSVERFREWLIGRTDFDTFMEGRAQEAYDDEQNIIRTGEPIVAKVERTPQADGLVTWCISTKMPWRDKEGRIIGTFGVSKDITALKKAEAELESAHRRLVETSRLAGMAEVASDVLHNVGNVLNSVNVSCSLTMERVKAAKIAGLSKTAALLEEQRGRLGEFFTNDPRGRQIPGYLAALAEHFGNEQSAVMQELEQLLKHIEHIKQIVAMQQNYAKVSGVSETVNPSQLIDDAIHLNAAAFTRQDVQLKCEFETVPMIQTEKHRVLQILVNLIRNAKYALDESKREDKVLTIKLGKNGGEHVKIQVIDNGVGIPPENLTRIFGHGFTTRRNGHGFGLHSSAIAIKELGGSLTAHSEGVGQGATFTLLLPQQPASAQANS